MHSIPEKPLQAMELILNCLLILNSFTSLVEGKCSTGREFQSLTVQGQKLLTYRSLKHLGIVTRKSCNLSK